MEATALGRDRGDQCAALECGVSEDESRGFSRGFAEGSILGMLWGAVMFLVVIPWLAS